jgi:hypothetical protein
MGRWLPPPPSPEDGSRSSFRKVVFQFLEYWTMDKVQNEVCRNYSLIGVLNMHKILLKLHHEEIHNLYSSPNIIRTIKSRRRRWTGHVARMVEKRNAYRILVGKLEGRRPLGRSWRRWVDYIKMDLWEIGWGGMDWIDLAQNRDQWRSLVNTIMNLWFPQTIGKFLSSCTIGDL